MLILLLKELLRWCRSIRVIVQHSDRHAKRCVPFVVTARPGKHGVNGGDGSHQVIHRPANDCVVVHAHVDIYHADSVANTWIGENTALNSTGFREELKVMKGELIY